MILNEVDRARARELIADFAGGDFNTADDLIGMLYRNGFEVTLKEEWDDEVAVILDPHECQQVFLSEGGGFVVLSGGQPVPEPGLLISPSPSSSLAESISLKVADSIDADIVDFYDFSGAEMSYLTWLSDVPRRPTDASSLPQKPSGLV